MASSPQPPPPSPPSASNSESSATHPDAPLPPKVGGEGGIENGVANAVEVKPGISHFQTLDSAEYLDKFKKYEVDYTRRLMAKYFSKKNIYGGNVFDEKTTIDNETIMSSRWPCTRSFADPLKSFEELNSTGSPSTSET